MAIEREGSDVLTYRAKWLDQVNRGGLFPLLQFIKPSTGWRVPGFFHADM